MPSLVVIITLLLALCLSSLADLYHPMLLGKPDGASYYLRFTYDIDMLSNEPGNCRDPWQRKVHVAYGEALTLMWLGRQTMLDLKEPQPSDRDLKAQWEWRRKAEHFRAMFGVEIPKGQGLGSAGNEVLRVFTAYLDAHIDVPGVQKANKFDLRCDDTYWKYVGPQEEDPDEPENSHRTIGQKYGERGMYEVQMIDSQWGFEWPYPELEPGMLHPLCGGEYSEDPPGMVTSMASEIRKTPILTMCPEILEYNAHSLRESANRLHHGLVYSTAEITTNNLMGSTWVHETGHLLYEWDDAKINARDVGNGKFVYDENSGEPKTAYTWAQDFLLAYHEPERALKNPDNYSNFATAMFFRDFWWIYGYSWDIDSVTGAPVHPLTKKPMDVETGEEAILAKGKAGSSRHQFRLPLQSSSRLKQNKAPSMRMMNFGHQNQLILVP